MSDAAPFIIVVIIVSVIIIIIVVMILFIVIIIVIIVVISGAASTSLRVQARRGGGRRERGALNAAVKEVCLCGGGDCFDPERSFPLKGRAGLRVIPQLRIPASRPRRRRLRHRGPRGRVDVVGTGGGRPEAGSRSSLASLDERGRACAEMRGRLPGGSRRSTEGGDDMGL